MARIVVGIDGSPGSRAALAWALDEARLRGATVQAARAWQWLVPYAPGVFAAGLDPDSMEQGERKLLDEVLADADTSGVDVEAVVITGTPAHALIEAAKGADLLVVGSRGRGGFAGLVLGSVSQQVAQHAPCPVVIVRSPDEGDR